MSMAGLLVAMCAINVATLLLLRAASRAREMSMRYALGAKRSRIVSQLLLEGGLLGIVGAAAGLALAPLVTNSLVRLLTNANPGPGAVLGNARCSCTSVHAGGCGCGEPAVQHRSGACTSCGPIWPILCGRVSGTASKSSQRFRKVAVGAQIALSVLLLGGAGLFVRTLDNLRHQQVGFETGHLVTFGLDPADSGYEGDRAVPIVNSALEAVQRIPGVTSVAATTDPELTGDASISSFVVEGHKASEEEKMGFECPWITPGYFATLKEPLLVGREFTAADAREAPKVAIVNVAFAKRFFGSAQNALGHLIGQ